MRRTLFVLSFLALFASSVFGKDPKLDKKLDDKVTKGNGSEKVRVIIQRRTPASSSERGDITNNGGSIRHEFKKLTWQVADVPVSTVAKLTKNPNIIHISTDEPVKSHAGDPYTVSGAALAFQTYGVTGQGIGVAVIDSGIAVHPDLTVAQAVDFVDPTRSGGYDPFGHGTHVAGIIAGSGAASNGLHKGIAPNVNLVDVRVLNQNGGGYSSDVISGIDWVMSNANTLGRNGKNLNIRVINLSFGHPPYESAEQDPMTQAARAAVQSGLIVVVSAGNNGKDQYGNVLYESITSPGIEPSVITVGAMTTWGTDSRADDTVGTYSSRGPTAFDHHIKPDIVAPGSHVISTISPGSYLATTYPSLITDGSYLNLSGTSMAAPVAAASVALMLEANPNMTTNAVKAALMFTAEAWPNVPYPPLTVGAGYLNTAGAVNLAANIDTTAPQSQNWIKNAVALNYNNVIGGTAAVWGQNLNWGSKQAASNSVFYNHPAWGQTIIWDDTSVWGNTVLWDQTIAWDESVVSANTLVWDETVVWAETIVWDETVVMGQ